MTNGALLEATSGASTTSLEPWRLKLAIELLAPELEFSRLCELL
jgi:hypothetical protein